MNDLDQKLIERYGEVPSDTDRGIIVNALKSSSENIDNPNDAWLWAIILERFYSGETLQNFIDNTKSWKSLCIVYCALRDHAPQDDRIREMMKALYDVIGVEESSDEGSSDD